MLLGNKADTDVTRPAEWVSTERGQALANEYGIPFMETSAKDGTNVNEAFNLIADAVRLRFQNQESTTSSNITLSGQALSSTGSAVPKQKCCGQ